MTKGWKPNGTIKSKILPIEIATNDYWEESNDKDSAVVDGKKRYFTWKEAMNAKVGDWWRLPTKEEWASLCDEFGGDELASTLSLGLNGRISQGELWLKGYSGYYWSADSISINSHFIHAIIIGARNANPLFEMEPCHKISVRLVRDIKE